jgi:pectin methylesterase-like acyl-CoA thioesterase
METPLHAQKVAILSRLVKESSLTLEEALLLLKEEEEKPAQQITTIQPGGWGETLTVPSYTGTIYTTGTTGESTSITYSNDSIITGVTTLDLNS